jgi:hypothetical protein
VSNQKDEKIARRTRPDTCLGALVGTGLALVCVVAVFVIWSRRGSLPEINQQAFDDAFEAWQSVEPPSYDIETAVTSRQPAVYVVQVRDGKVVKATRNGVELKQIRTMGTWSVPGMFDTIQRDLRNTVADPNDRITPRSPRVTVRASFHPQWHYPQTYQRIQWGSPYEVAWSVARFEVIDGPGAEEQTD